jgi:serine/threonine protein kinase
MAPEIVKLIGQSRQERDGYTRAVDWWGLGVTTYKMLTGRMPFIVPVQPRFAALRSRTSDYEVLMQAPDYPLYLEESAKVQYSAKQVNPNCQSNCQTQRSVQRLLLRRGPTIRAQHIDVHLRVVMQFFRCRRGAKAHSTVSTDTATV